MTGRWEWPTLPTRMERGISVWLSKASTSNFTPPTPCRSKCCHSSAGPTSCWWSLIRQYISGDRSVHLMVTLPLFDQQINYSYQFQIVKYQDSQLNTHLYIKYLLKEQTESFCIWISLIVLVAQYLTLYHRHKLKDKYI